jgi:hypothetical protein
LVNATASSLEKVKTQEEADKAMSIFEKQAESLASKDNSSVQQAYTIGLNNKISGHLNMFQKVSEATRAKDAHDQWNFAYSRAIDSWDYVGAQKIAKLALDTEVIGQAEFSNAITNLPWDISFSQARKDLVTDPQKVIDKFSNPSFTKGMTGPQLDKRDDIITQAMSQISKNRTALKDQQEKETWDLYKKSEDGSLTLTDLDKSVMPADEKQEIWRNYQAAQAEKFKLGVSKIEEGDPAVLAQVNAIIDLKPERITPEQIYKLVDKGLGTKHVTTVVDRLNRNLKDKNPVNNKYRSELSRLMRAKLFGNPDKSSTSETYIKLSNKLDVFLESSPTDEQAQRFFSGLIKEDVRTFGILGSNNLPGFGDNPLEVEIPEKTGVTKATISFGDIVEIDGEFYQAVGRKEGKVEWRKVKPQ